MLKDEHLCQLNLKGVKMIRHDQLDELPIKRNLLLIVLAVVGHVYLFFGLPALMQESALFLLLLPITLLLVITNGVLVHEAIHGLVWPSSRGNEFVGRLCGILVGVCFDLQRYDHIQHHVHSSTEKNSPDVKVITNNSAVRIGRLRHHYQCTVGLFISEFYFNLVTCFRSQKTIRTLRCSLEGDANESSGQLAMRQILQKGRLRQVRVDGAWIWMVHLVSVYCFRDHLWLFAAIFFARAGLLTTLDSFAHFKTPVNSRWFAKNIRLPLLIEKWIFMNFNLHGVHHVFPDQSWVELPVLRDRNSMGIQFSYHQGLIGALADKFAMPKYVREFPSSTKAFEDIPDEADAIAAARTLKQ
jgi:fatty acid desaturase